MSRARAITAEISAGELIDKMSILQIKVERITESSKLENVRTELQALTEARDRAIVVTPELDALSAQLKSANESLWDIEDGIRDCERRSDFGEEFIRLARSVYHTNDRRCNLKRQINELLGSRLVEEKSYKDY
jgi:hypothetical protein